MRVILPILEKRDFKLLIPIFTLFLIFGVVAYSATFSGGDPVASGHSSNEINVKKSDGSVATLQEFVNNFNPGRGKTLGTIKQYEDFNGGCPYYTCGATAKCSNGERAVGGGCFFTSGITQHRINRPEDSNGDNKWDQWSCWQYSGDTNPLTTRAYVICVS